MTRLLHVTTSDMSLELLLGPQLRAFQAAGYEVHTASAPGPYVEGLAADGIVHHPLRHATRAVAPHRDAAALVELVRLCRAVRPDVLHTHNPKPGIYGRLAGRVVRVPRIVNTQHGLYAQPTDPRPRRWPVYGLERLAATCSDVELVQNPEDLDTLVHLGVPRHKLWFLGNGIDLARFRPDPDARAATRRELGIADHEVLVGTVGRLVQEKGYRELFAAAASLAPRHPELRWVVVGPNEAEKGDPLTDADVAGAEATGFRFLGRRDDPERLYPAMDLFVLASHREGWPRAAMEALACGVPVVATDIRGCRQVVDHERTGLLVPAGDPGALAGAIEHLARDPERRARLGTTGQQTARERFDQQVVITTTIAAYGGPP